MREVTIPRTKGKGKGKRGKVGGDAKARMGDIDGIGVVQTDAAIDPGNR
jgi:hypothetical protein